MRTIMVHDVEIKYVSKAERASPPLSITHVGGIRPDGKVWTLTEAEVIESIKNGVSFHVKVTNRRVQVIVATRKNRPYLKTALDRDGPDQLLELPECPYIEDIAIGCDGDAQEGATLKTLNASGNRSPQSQRQVASRFMETAEQCFLRMQGLVVRGDSREWQTVLHELKEAATDIHAKELVALCKHGVDVADDAVSRMSAFLKIKESYEGLLVSLRTAKLLRNTAHTD
jgi:Protein of unknown function (DUF3892)